jgi:hypothetical protein
MPKGAKYGGRKKGTPNKATTLTKQAIANLLGDYHESGLMEKDFRELDGKDRLEIATKMAKFVLPQMQSSSIDVSVNDDKKTLSDELTELAKDPDENEKA